MIRALLLLTAFAACTGTTDVVTADRDLGDLGDVFDPDRIADRDETEADADDRPADTADDAPDADADPDVEPEADADEAADETADVEPEPEPEPEVDPEPVAAPTQDELLVTVVAKNLDTVWELAFAPDGALFATERPGRVVRIEAAATANPGAPVKVLDITATVKTGGEAGLMGMALSPDFATDGFAYLCYTYRGPGDAYRNRVSRFAFSGSAFAGETIFQDEIPGAVVHDGCRVRIGPDRNLWYTMGDAADTATSQNPTSLAGKIHRLTLDPAARIPADNPTAGSTIYASGVRNPQGLDFHPITGKGYFSEHGPDTNDEINVIEAGANFGWPTHRGAPGATGFADSIFTYTPTLAVCGLALYRGARVPGWRDSLFFVTLKERDLRRIRLNAPDYRTTSEPQQTLFDGAYGRLRALIQGPDGCLYVGTSNRDGRGQPVADDDRVLRICPRG